MIGRLLFLCSLAASAIILPQQMQKFASFTSQAHVRDGENMQMVMNPLVGQILNASEAQRQSAQQRVPLSDRIREGVKLHQRTLAVWMWRVFLGLIATGIVLLVLGVKGAARTCLGLCHSMAHLWLLFFSVCAVLVFIALNVNLWIVLVPALWKAPVVAILICLVLFRLIDVNFPLWNSSVTSFLAPVGACLFMLAWGKFGLSSKVDRGGNFPS